MHKYVWTSLIVTIVGAGALFWTLKATVEYKPPLPRNVPRNITREELEQVKQRAKEERTPTPRPESRALAQQTHHDFGTLDPDVLDDVMHTLEGLRAGGRTVGIVSHVTELKSRIADRIEIVVKEDRTSTLRVTA